MKKLLLALLLSFLAVAFTSCTSPYKENEWFSEDKLFEAGIQNLPVPEAEKLLLANGSTVYFTLKNAEYDSYISSFHEYLKSCNFKYFGTRGDQKATLAGLFTTYYFKPASELSEFKLEYGSGYHFVFSSGETDEDGDIVFYILGIRRDTGKTVEYDGKLFSYNTEIYFKKGSDALLSGRYVLESHSVISSGDLIPKLLVSPKSEALFGEKITFAVSAEEAGIKVFIKDTELIPKLNSVGLLEYTFDMPNKPVYINCTNAQEPPEAAALINLLPWMEELSSADISKIRFSTHEANAIPGSLISNRYIEDASLISAVVSGYKNASVTSLNTDQPLEEKTSVTFVFSDSSSHTFEISDGNIIDKNGQKYEISETPLISASDISSETLSFFASSTSYKLYDSANLIGEYSGIDEFEFVEYTGPITLQIPTTYIEADFGILRIYNSSVFSYESTSSDGKSVKFYQLVGNMSFPDLP